MCGMREVKQDERDKDEEDSGVCMCISKLGKLGETAMQYMNVM